MFKSELTPGFGGARPLCPSDRSVHSLWELSFAAFFKFDERLVDMRSTHSVSLCSQGGIPLGREPPQGSLGKSSGTKACDWSSSSGAGHLP